MGFGCGTKEQAVSVWMLKVRRRVAEILDGAVKAEVEGGAHYEWRGWGQGQTLGQTQGQIAAPVQEPARGPRLDSAPWGWPDAA